MQEVNEGQIKVKDINSLPGFEGDPQQTEDQRLPDHKENHVVQRQKNCVAWPWDCCHL